MAKQRVVAPYWRTSTNNHILVTWLQYWKTYAMPYPKKNKLRNTYILREAFYDILLFCLLLCQENIVIHQLNFVYLKKSFC